MNSDNQSAGSQTKNITLGLVLSWLVGVLLLFIGVTYLVTHPLEGILILIGGVIMLPPFNGLMQKKFNVHLSGGVRFVIAIVLFIAAISMSTKAAVDKAVSNANSGTQTVSGGTVSTNANQLELVSYSCDKEYGYFTIKGQVKNISGASMKDVQVVGSIYTSDGTFVTSSDALIEYNPILPGQTSPFTTMSTDNPEATKCQVEFKEFFGGTIPTKVDK
jgi:hypothetical protein